MADTGKYVTLDIVFECPKGHKIRRSIHHVQSPGAHRLIEEQSFTDLKCPICKWKGAKRGGQAKQIKAR